MNNARKEDLFFDKEHQKVILNGFNQLPLPVVKNEVSESFNEFFGNGIYFSSSHLFL